MAKLIRKILTKKFLYREYIINKKSIRLIAKEIGCNKTTIEYYIKKYKIKMRTISEALRSKIRPIEVRKKISKTRIKRQVAKGINNFGYIDGRCSKIYYCKEKGCANKISYKTAIYGKGRCPSCAKILSWQNKEYREKCLKAIFAGQIFSPNNPEKLLMKLLNEALPKTYKFVGDGKLIIGGFCPDFVNKDNNKIIELYGDYWHNLPNYKKRDKRRLITYKKTGYQTLIIWGHELKDLEKVKEKVLAFTKKTEDKNENEKLQIKK